MEASRRKQSEAAEGEPDKKRVRLDGEPKDFFSLPVDVILPVMHNLPVKDLICIRVLSKHIKEIAEQDWLWRERAKERGFTQEEGENWYTCYCNGLRKDMEAIAALSNVKLPHIQPEQYKVFLSTNKSSLIAEAAPVLEDIYDASGEHPVNKPSSEDIQALDFVLVHKFKTFGEEPINPLGCKLEEDAPPKEADDDYDEEERVVSWTPCGWDFFEEMLSTDGYKLGCLNNKIPVTVQKADGSMVQELFSSDPEVKAAIKRAWAEYDKEAEDFVKKVKGVFAAPYVCYSGAHALGPDTFLDRDEVFAAISGNRVFVFWAYYSRFYG